MATRNSNSQYQSQVLKKAVSDAYHTSYQIKGTNAPKEPLSKDVKKTITIKK